MKKILITGSDGFLGRKLITNLPGYDVTGIGRDLDIRTYKTEQSFDVIIHCAAKKDLMWCQNNFNEAWDINVNGTINISRIKHNMFIYISSDMVTDTQTRNGNRYPSTIYGLTKYESEKFVKKYLHHYCTIRPSLIYDSKIKWIDDIVSSGKNLYAYYDRWRNYCYIGDCVKTIRHFTEIDTYNIYRHIYTTNVEPCEFMSQLVFVKKYLEKNNINYPITPISRMSTEHGKIGPEAIS